MNLNIGQITLIDFIGQLERKEIIINRDYQRSSGVWPATAKSYFIDTILEGYPFPKVYLYQVFNEKTKRPIKELIDGQQRIMTILSYLKDDFALNSSSKKFNGMRYSDLDEDTQRKFLSYQIETSLIYSASRPELLEMFRRINAYTAPLSAAEKRHAMYQGDFKWFIVEMADKYAPILENLSILTAKNLARMGDAEFIADLVLSLEYGIEEKSAKNIDGLYKKYDEKFPSQKYYTMVIDDFFNFMNKDLISLHNTFIMKSYVINSLFSAFIHIKYGLPSVESFTKIQPNKQHKFDFDRIIPKLESLAHAHEAQDEDGPYKEYVDSCNSSTTKLGPRRKRFSILIDALM